VTGQFQPRRRGHGFLLVVRGHEADGQGGAAEACARPAIWLDQPRAEPSRSTAWSKREM
jgi:hypothetical protein